MATEVVKRAAWAKAKKVKGKDPKRYRKDRFGNCMFWGSHGRKSPMGWEIDHWVPLSKGGKDTPRNRNAMNTCANRKKGDHRPTTETFKNMWRAKKLYFDKHPKCQPVLTPATRMLS